MELNFNRDHSHGAHSNRFVVCDGIGSSAPPPEWAGLGWVRHHLSGVSRVSRVSRGRDNDVPPLPPPSSTTKTASLPSLRGNHKVLDLISISTRETDLPIGQASDFVTLPTPSSAPRLLGSSASPSKSQVVLSQSKRASTSFPRKPTGQIAKLQATSALPSSASQAQEVNETIKQKASDKQSNSQPCA